MWCTFYWFKEFRWIHCRESKRKTDPNKIFEKIQKTEGRNNSCWQYTNHFMFYFFFYGKLVKMQMTCHNDERKNERALHWANELNETTVISIWLLEHCSEKWWKSSFAQITNRMREKSLINANSIQTKNILQQRHQLYQQRQRRQTISNRWNKKKKM